MDDAFRREVRQAEQDGDYQRLYHLLHRIGRPADAEKLFLDHPIKVECTVQYEYEARWTSHDAYHRGDTDTQSFTLDGLVEKLVAARVGAARIHIIERSPTYRLLDGEIKTTYFGSKLPLPSITLSVEELQAVKVRVRAHPRYMQGASLAQLEAAQEADDRDAERAQQVIEAETRRAQRLALEEQYSQAFERDSLVYKDEIWELWQEHKHLPRNQFAQQAQHPLQCILFYLKTHQDRDKIVVTSEFFDEVWERNAEKRYRIYVVEGLRVPTA